MLKGVTNDSAVERLLDLKRFIYSIAVPNEDLRTAWVDGIDRACTVLNGQTVSEPLGTWRGDYTDE